MTIAEIKGKLPSELEDKENLLTSDVFGTLKNVDRQRGLRRFLSALGINISEEEAENAKFLFWERLEDAEPDLIIDTMPENKGGCLIFLEAKYLTPLGNDETQLEREYKNGSKMAREKDKLFTLICVTKDFIEPKEIIESTKKSLYRELGVKYEEIKVKWINWQSILAMLTKVADDRDLDSPSKRQIGDLIELLKFKGLEYFIGFMEEEILSLKEALKIVEKIMHDIFVLGGNLTEDLKRYNISIWRETINRIERDGTSRALSDFDDWTVSYYALPYFKKDWWDTEGLYDIVLFVKVFLDPFELWVGCTLEKDRTDIKLKKNYYWNLDMNSFVSYLDEESFEETEILREYKPIKFDEVKSLNKKDFGYRVVVYDRISLKEFTSVEALKEIMARVLKFEDMAPKISKYLEKKSLSIGTKVKAIWEKGRKYYPGKIAEIKDGKFRIDFDDGYEGWVTKENMYLP